MKRLPYALIASLIVLLGSWSGAQAVSTFITGQGGTGTTSPSGILYGDNGATTHLNTVTVGTGLSFSGGTLSNTGALFGYPFPNNATTTILTFTGGLVSSASSTINTLHLGTPLETTSGGTGITSYTLGDTLYASAANTLSTLAGNTASSTRFLAMTGTGSAAAAPVWTSIPIAGSKAYYAYSTQATSSPAYFNMNPTASTTSTTNNYVLAVGANTVQNWITPTGDPGVTVVPGGTYSVDLYAWRSSGSASITLAVQIWEVSSTGADVSLIATTNSTPNLTNAKAQYNVSVTTGPHAMGSTGNRILMRVIATSAGTPTLSLAMGDGDQMDLVTPGATVDVTNFVPYTGATANLNLGAFNASSSQLTVSGNTWLTGLGAGAVSSSAAGLLSSGTLSIANGGTGSTTAPVSQVLYGGATSYQSVATSSPTLSAGLSSSGTLGALVGGANTTISQIEHRSFTYATTTWTGTTTIPIETGYGEVWNSVVCFTDVGTLNVDFYHSTSHLNFFNASTTNNTNAFSTNNTITSGDKAYVDIGTPASSPTKINCTVKDTI